MSPEWQRLSPAERDAYLNAQDAACAEEHRLYRIEETARDALRIAKGDRAEAERFLADVLNELRLLTGGGA